MTLMIHPRTGQHCDRHDFLLEEIERCKHLVTKAEKRYRDYVTERDAPPRPEPEVSARMADNLKHWRKYGAPSLSLHDEKAAFKSMADGKMYTSQRKYRDEIKARGYEEIGNERKAFDKGMEFNHAAYDKGLERDIEKTMGELGL